MRNYGTFSLRIASEIHQLQDIFDGALFADQAARPGGAIEDQILLFHFDWKWVSIRGHLTYFFSFVLRPFPSCGRSGCRTG